eukprot:TRINITY_DN51052_c0_g1_i1.p1 TRINITY_DN51052_c0_g1~~TRINITY_DN51052_c0_g1_i1.p1  ORF type:complete len:343 (-),score=55.93 TRINITY_DN51052_c0_g1_i1:33-1061(-)
MNTQQPYTPSSSSLHKLFDETQGAWEGYNTDAGYKIASSKDVLRGSAYRSLPETDLSTRTAFKRPSSPPIRKAGERPARARSMNSPSRLPVWRQTPVSGSYGTRFYNRKDDLIKTATVASIDHTAGRVTARPQAATPVSYQVPKPNTHKGGLSKNLVGDVEELRSKLEQVRSQRDYSNMQYSAKVAEAEEQEHWQGEQLQAVKEMQLSPGAQARRFKQAAQAESKAFVETLAGREHLVDIHQQQYQEAYDAARSHREEMSTLHNTQAVMDRRHEIEQADVYPGFPGFQPGAYPRGPEFRPEAGYGFPLPIAHGAPVMHQPWGAGYHPGHSAPGPEWMGGGFY